MICNNIEGFISLKPASYRFLKTFSLTRNVSQEGCGQFDAEIIISKISGDAVENIRIRCTNAFNIVISDIETVSGIHIEIENVSDRQLEGATYEVKESEEGAFSFYCAEFSVDLISNESVVGQVTRHVGQSPTYKGLFYKYHQ